MMRQIIPSEFHEQVPREAISLFLSDAVWKSMTGDKAFAKSMNVGWFPQKSMGGKENPHAEEK